MLTRFKIAGGTLFRTSLSQNNNNNIPNRTAAYGTKMLRKTLTTNSNFLARVFLAPPSLSTTYFKPCASFLVSGLIHATGDYVLYHTFSQGGALRFFLL